MYSFNWASSQNVPEQVAKRNLVPHLRALQSARASSAAFALCAELRLAPHWRSLLEDFPMFSEPVLLMCSK